MERQTLTVTQLNSYLKGLVDSDVALRHLTVKGEISNFTNHRSSGHFYFTIKDATSSMRVVMFKTYASQVAFEPQNGMNVLVVGAIRVFERDGALQLYCQQLLPDGIGALAMAYEQLKEKLERQGLFDPTHKRSLPPFPHTIGVVTSKTGAALQDIYNVLARRYPIGRMILIPTLVQGADAPASICRAIELANETGLFDLLIVGRGGGSLEDLWAFNDETVARAIYDSNIPIISAVGHEIDVTIADFVADLRAPTPSAAAELAVPDCALLQQSLSVTEKRLHSLMQGRLAGVEKELQQLEQRLQKQSPKRMIAIDKERLEMLQRRLSGAMAQQMKNKEQQLLKQTALLEALSPLNVMTRGYSITYHNNRVLQTDTPLKIGDRLTTKLNGMTVDSVVETIEREGI